MTPTGKLLFLGILVTTFASFAGQVVHAQPAGLTLEEWNRCIDEGQTRYGLDPDIQSACEARIIAGKKRQPQSVTPPRKTQNETQTSSKPAAKKTPPLSEEAKLAKKIDDLIASVAKDPDVDPWKKSGSDKKKSSSRAPYADKSCADVKSIGTGPVDWDYTRIYNKCDFPIQVITCYYDEGEPQNCYPARISQYGTSSTIQPNASAPSVTTSRTPQWRVRYFVCNMQGVENNSKLCMLPG